MQQGKEIAAGTDEKRQTFFERSASDIDSLTQMAHDLAGRLRLATDSMCGPMPPDDKAEKGPTEVPGTGTRRVEMSLVALNQAMAVLESQVSRLEQSELI